jgi:hypothetical protein
MFIHDSAEKPCDPDWGRDLLLQTRCQTLLAQLLNNTCAFVSRLDNFLALKHFVCYAYMFMYKICRAVKASHPIPVFVFVAMVILWLEELFRSSAGHRVFHVSKQSMARTASQCWRHKTLTSSKLTSFVSNYHLWRNFEQQYGGLYEVFWSTSETIAADINKKCSLQNY